MHEKKFFVAAVLLVLAVAAVAGCTGTSAPTATPAASTTAAPTANATQNTTMGPPSGSFPGVNGTPPSGSPPSGSFPGMNGTPPMGGASTVKANWSDVAYANASSAEKLDIYLPSNGTGPYPVVMVIHGGGFEGGDKQGGETNTALAALDRGYAVVAIDYRLSGEAKFPAQISDVKAAIRYIRANAAQYGLNGDKIAVWGCSAGGNLAALAGTSGGVASLENDSLGNAGVSDKVQAAIDWYGPIDFLTMDDQFKQLGTNGQVHNDSTSAESKLLGANITTVPDKVAAANPETYITADDPAFFLEYGTADANIPYLQGTVFADKLKAVLGNDSVKIKLLQGASHGDAAYSTASNLNETLDWLDSVMKK